MDLGTIQEYLSDFATFAKNIGPALQNWQDLVYTIVDFLGGEGSSQADDTAIGIDMSAEALSSGSSAAD